MIAVWSADGLRDFLQRESEKQMPEVPHATAYVFRHAFATRLRDQGFEAEDLGAFLGHSASESQRLYGFKVGAGKRGKKNRAQASIRVEVPREVRPLDRSGLAQVKDLPRPKA